MSVSLVVLGPKFFNVRPSSLHNEEEEEEEEGEDIVDPSIDGEVGSTLDSLSGFDSESLCTLSCPGVQDSVKAGRVD